jgi:hypothetical protein
MLQEPGGVLRLPDLRLVVLVDAGRGRDRAIRPTAGLTAINSRRWAAGSAARIVRR